VTYGTKIIKTVSKMEIVKALIIILLLGFAVGKASAQETYFDLLLNYNPTNFNYGKDNDLLKDYKKNLWGVRVGAGFQGGITPHLSLVSEFYFSMKGGRLKSGNPLTTNASRTRLFTLELPVLARVHFHGIYLNAGPTIGYNIGGKVKVEGSEGMPRQFYNISFDGSEGSYKRWDAGVQFGGGYEFKVENTRVAFDVRYHYGLTDIYNSGERYNRNFSWDVTVSRAWINNPLAKR
jgi:hypothetical protein